jgi:putative nucleotidyltransferase with HDIG domain
MHVHFLTDEPNKIAKMRALLEPQHSVDPTIVGSNDIRVRHDGVVMVDADLRCPQRIEQIRCDLQALREIRERLFIVEKSMHAMVVQAQALGATGIVSRPREIVAAIAEIAATRRADYRETMAPQTSEMAESARALSSIFTAVLNDLPVKLIDAETATSQVITGVTQNGLTAWLDDVRRYHESTFQHCLLVTGVAVGFALHLRFAPADVKRLGMAATLHDIGKARIPLAILDKPGKLDAAEQAAMQAHPLIGYDALKNKDGVGPEMLDAIRHHHEYLDGSGYPDGLRGGQISDIVRLLTISDIFAALIESRPYRAPMARPDAYSIVCGMEGKLEPALLRAFRDVALKA